jgi:uncharacterized protein YdcH (DUF465 family)
MIRRAVARAHPAPFDPSIDPFRRSRMVASKDDLNLRRLEDKHREYEERLFDLQRRRFLTEEEQVEETTLKKLKLRIKDEIASIRRLHPELAEHHG